METLQEQSYETPKESWNIFWEIQSFIRNISDSLLLQDKTYYLREKVLQISCFEELLKVTKIHSTFSWESLVIGLWIKKVYSTNELTADFTQNLRGDREINFRTIMFFLEKDLGLNPPEILEYFQKNKIFFWSKFLDEMIQNSEVFWWNWYN
jgi:hypothetical protein